MNTISVDILNPASLRLLKELAELRLIAIHNEETVKSKIKSDNFVDLVKKIRSNSQNPPSLEEITAEVEQQRTEMYAVSA